MYKSKGLNVSYKPSETASIALEKNSEHKKTMAYIGIITMAISLLLILSNLFSIHLATTTFSLIRFTIIIALNLFVVVSFIIINEKRKDIIKYDFEGQKSDEDREILHLGYPKNDLKIIGVALLIIALQILDLVINLV
ncbi:hypothetical protein [Staphylococcus equorum]|uniref:DUF3899 domain-containing protein n=1 Tax=Staphylococcus equorum TaxID=246432 RepID=A0AAP7IGG2_9STAP|nr:hypothetical protein [Staphylococcus equorum]OEK58958.1 hypothetical protein ASS94_01130 [Staphylococcus equorum]